VKGRIIVLAATAVGAAVLFVVFLTILILRPDDLVALDRLANEWVAPYRTAWVLAGFLWLTTLGTGAALFGMAVTATGFLWAHRQAPLILPLWVTFLGAQASVWTLKYVVNRARPDFLVEFATAASPSFPSAHATGSVATLGFIAYAIGCGLPARKAERSGIALCAAGAIAAIGLSRVVLSVHFGTDIIGGLLLGGAWLSAGIALAEHKRRAGTPVRHHSLT
jgi:membrane-associated phospholipid phosphatase